jgi:hypothetical protein
MWRGLGYRSSGRLFAVSRYGHGLVGSSMRNTGAGIGKPTFLKLPCFPIIPPPFKVNRRRTCPAPHKRRHMLFRSCSSALMQFESLSNCTSVCTGVTPPIKTTKIGVLDRLRPHEWAIDGPAVQPTTAPTTAPIGPNTTAPDNAPSAASPPRSCAIATEEISDRASAAIAVVFFMQSPCFRSVAVPENAARRLQFLRNTARPTHSSSSMTRVNRLGSL